MNNSANLNLNKKKNSNNNSYSDIFINKKESTPRMKNIKPPNKKTSEKNSNANTRLNTIINEKNMNIDNYNNLNYNHPPIHPQTTKSVRQNVHTSNNRENVNGRLSRSNSNSLNLSNYSANANERTLSPKSHYKFQNNLMARCKSTDKLKTVTTRKKNESFNTLDSLQNGETSVHYYLQRRHTEAREKLQKIKNELQEKEVSQLRDRPKISKNSKRIVDKLRSNNENVIERLTSKAHDRKKSEEINKIQEINQKNTKKPVINITSEKLQRTIDDLYSWKDELDKKKGEIMTKQNSHVDRRPQILKESEEMLKEKHPEYLKNKVEDRLIEKGMLAKYKLEEQKEILIDNILNGGSSNTDTLKKLKSSNSQSKIVRNMPKQKTNKTADGYDNKNSVNRSNNFKSDSRIIPLSMSQKNSANNSVEKDNNILHTNQRSKNTSLEKKTKVSQQASVAPDKANDVRKHLNNYYESKVQSDKQQLYKRYMTTHDEVSNSRVKEDTNYSMTKDRPINVDHSSNINYSNDFSRINTFTSSEMKPKPIQETYINYNKPSCNYNSNYDLEKEYAYNNHLNANQITSPNQVYTKAANRGTFKQTTNTKPEIKYNFNKNILNETKPPKANYREFSDKENRITFQNDNYTLNNYTNPQQIENTDQDIPYITESNINNNANINYNTNISSHVQPTGNRRIDDLNQMSNYINSLRSDDRRSSTNSINYYPTKIIDHSEGNHDLYSTDNQFEQEKIRNEISRKIKNQAYQNEYNRVDNNLDYVNERLKLNNLSKSYLLNKINEFTAVKNDNNNDQNNYDYNETPQPVYNNYNNNMPLNNTYEKRNQNIIYNQENNVYNNQIGKY